MIEFQTFDDLIKHFNYQSSAYQTYLQSLSIEDLNCLLNKPNWFKDIFQKVRLLVEFRDNLEIQKLIVNNIIEKDFSTIISDNNILTVVLGYIKTNKELFSSFLSILNSSQVITILDIIFDGGADLNILPDTADFLNKIEKYIDSLTEKDSKKLTAIYKSLYSTKNASTNNIAKTILKVIIKKSLHPSFYKFYKELICPAIDDDETNEIVNSEPNLKEQEKIVELFFLLLTSTSETFGFDKEQTSIQTLVQLKSLGIKQADNLLEYMKNLVESSSYLLEHILANSTLIQYIPPKKIIKGLTTNSNNSNEEILMQLLSNDNMNPNIISIFDTRRLSIIFPFAVLNYDRYRETIKDFLKKYFSYERAVFFLSFSYMPEFEKQKIIKELYQKDIESISLEKSNLINRAIEDILSLKEPTPEYIKDILPELLALPYDEVLFKKLKKVCLELNQEEYLKVFLSQLFKKKNLSVKAKFDENNLYFNPEFSEDLGSAHRDTIEVRTEDYDDTNLEEQNMEYIETLYHELVHLYQVSVMPYKISIDALMNAYSCILFLNGKYSGSAYWELWHEIHARTHGHYDTWKLIRDITPTITANTTKEQFIEDRRIFRSNSFKTGDHNPQAKTKSTIYFANLINNFFSKISSEDIIEYRKKYKTLELVTNEQGIPYTPEEIEGFINSFKASDLKYDATNKAIYTFYIRYLQLLTDGLNLSDDRINIYDVYGQRRMVS